jgi:hypothetical protein
MNFLSNPLVGTALTGGLAALGAPRLGGLGGAISRGGVAAMYNLPNLMKAQQEQQLFPYTLQEKQQGIQKGALDIKSAQEKLDEEAELEKERAGLPPEQKLASRLAPTQFVQHQFALEGNKTLSGSLTAAAAAEPNTDRGRFFAEVAPLVAGSSVPVSMSDITSAYTNNQELSLRSKLNNAQIANLGQEMQQRGQEMQVQQAIPMSDRVQMAEGARSQTFYSPSNNSFRTGLQPQGDEVPSGGPQIQQGIQQVQQGGLNLQTLQQMSPDERKDTMMGARPQVFYSPSKGTSRLGTRPQGDEITQEQAPKTQDFYNPTTKQWSQGVVAPPGALPGDVARFMLQLPIQYQGVYEKAYTNFVNTYKASSHFPYFGGSSAQQLDNAAQAAAWGEVNRAMNLGNAKGDTTNPLATGTGSPGWGGVGTTGGGTAPPGTAPAAAPSSGADWTTKYGG